MLYILFTFLYCVVLQLVEKDFSPSSDEGKKRREAHQQSIQKLEDQFAETKRKEKKHLEERLMAKRNAKKGVYIDTVFIALIKCMHTFKI